MPAKAWTTTLHYSRLARHRRSNKAFRLAYAKTYKLQPDVYAVQGYDAGQLLAAGADAVKGDVATRPA
jgi:branched-chain amino acid transport system substrate-binding protein